MSTEKKIGKILNVRFGFGGYQGAEFGLFLTFGSKSGGWGVSDSVSTWGPEVTPPGNAGWTEADRSALYDKTMRKLGDLLVASKKHEVFQLVGVPVEVEFEGGRIKSWRVLEEVL